MTTITANDLKTKGISALQPVITESHEALISIRGHNRFVVMDMERYNQLRECELEAALTETRKDIEAGRIFNDSVATHIRRIRRG